MIGPIKRRRLTLVAALILSLISPSGLAHPMAPVLITVTQLNETEYSALWTFSRDEGAVDPASLSLAFEPICALSKPAILTAADNRWLREERYECGHLGSESFAVGVVGLQLIDTYVALRLVDTGQNEQIYLLDDHSSMLNLAREHSGQNTFSQYLALGGQHILTGVDHVLFVVALCFLAGGAIRTLIALITAFTVAHSITLSAAVLGWVSLASRPVEALIALSIALVAVDLVKKTQLSKKRIVDYWPVVFVFGLLHGLGFAGALAEFGLPQDAMLTALLAFNSGVELGQLGVVLVCAMLIKIIAKARDPGWLNPAVGLGIGCTAGFWFVSRVL